MTVVGKRVPRRTICIVHREIYSRLANITDAKERQKVETLLCEAYQMGKRMSGKLREYKFYYIHEMFDPRFPEDAGPQ